MTTEFFVPMKLPTTTHQEKEWTVRNGKPVPYEPEKLKAARAKFMAHFAKHVPDKMYSGGPLRLTTKWCFPMIKGVENGQYKHTKPDTDNIVKLPKDCMSELGFWKDDALVASEIIEKFWAETPGVYVKIEEL